jgi:hypothetical protein
LLQNLPRISYPSLARFLLPAALLLGPAALAQTPNASPAATPVLPSLPTKPAEPSAAAVALGRDIVLASGLARSLQAIVPQLLDQTYATVTRTRPDLVRDLNEVMKMLEQEFSKNSDELVTKVAQVYAVRLSEAQLKDTAAYFNSPAGKAYVESQPIVLSAATSLVQETTQRLSTDIVERVRAEMKKRGHEM